MASIFDKSEGAIRAWETGRTKPDTDTLIKIADYFETSADYLLGRSKAKKPENEAAIANLGISNNAVENIKQCSARFQGTDRFLSHSIFSAFMNYVTAYWMLDDAKFMSDPENNLGISFHESVDRKTREIIIKHEITDLITMILDE
jgi:transcriptional regulator with XRE-family HTH domain